MHQAAGWVLGASTGLLPPLVHDDVMTLNVTLKSTVSPAVTVVVLATKLSMLPLAVSVAAPALVLSAGAGLTVVAVQASGEATVWVLERASDGARASVTVSGAVAGGASLLVGTAVAVTAVSAGWVLSAAGQVIAFVPNEIGKALLHNERITR